MFMLEHMPHTRVLYAGSAFCKKNTAALRLMIKKILHRLRHLPPQSPDYHLISGQLQNPIVVLHLFYQISHPANRLNFEIQLAQL